MSSHPPPPIEVDAGPARPRWGNESRDRRALAIWHTLLQHRGAQIADMTWLDVGCGSGGIAATVASRARTVIGVDPEAWPEWAATMAQHSNLSLVVGTFDGARPPLPDGSIDIVICNQVYEHVADPQALMRNIHRVLVPGGTCYFAGPNLLWPIEPHVSWPFVHWLPRRFARALMRALRARYAEYLDAWSTHFWRLRSWFRASGFEVEPALASRIAAGLHVRGSVRTAALVSKTPRVLSWLGLPLSPGFVFVLRKPADSPGGTASAGGERIETQ